MPDDPSGPAGLGPVDSAPFVAAAGRAAVNADDPRNYTVDGLSPRIVVRPPSLEALSETLRRANDLGQAVIVQGGRTAVGVGNRPRRYDVAIDTRDLDSLTAYEPDDFTVTAQAGMPFADLQRALAERGQFVPLDPSHAATATVGGVLALGRGGPRRNVYGTPRDWLIGCSLALADGTTIKGGGRVVKNVSGYDLPKLFAGSLGTLGCIVEATFKLRPLPAVDSTLSISCRDFTAALDLGRRISLEVNGLHAAVALDARSARDIGLGGATLLLRAAGVQPAVVAVLDAARLAAGVEAAPEETDPVLWQAISDLETPAQPAVGLLLRSALKPSRLPAAAAALRATLPNARLWSYADTGLLFAALPHATTEAALDARAEIGALGGSLIVDVAPPAIKAQIDVWGAPGDGLPIMRRIKERFDPNAMLSPGRFVGGI